MFIAHSAPNERIRPHSLEDHTRGVLERSLVYSRSFDPFGITAVAALAHDLGKKTKEFQSYIQSNSGIRGSVKHALGGTILLQEIPDIRAQLAGIMVAGHHAGLPDAKKLIKEKIPAVALTEFGE
ncbi:CRISPR-associated endonuclease Cas3'' [Halalkalibacter lacteus]|uniref:CRISPR-associated endonuclease Cas3'' n=1 Tax=Halalkalibacter lacteus TaxID=3090663 RepID=UPI002FCB79E9